MAYYKIKKFVIIISVVIMTFAMSVTAFCIDDSYEITIGESTATQEEYKHILVDAENVLTDSEQLELYKLLDATANKIKCHVGLVFTKEFYGMSSYKFAEEFYRHAFGAETDGTILVISELGDYFYTSGKCDEIFGSSADKLLLTAYEGLKSGGFFGLSKAYCNFLVDKFLNNDVSNIPDFGYSASIIDLDDTFTDAEEKELYEILKNTADKIECNIGVVTTASLGGKSDRQYTEDMLDVTFGFGSSSIMLMLFNNPTSDKTYGDWISTCGKGTDAFQSRLDSIFDSVYDGLDSSGFYKAITNFSNCLERYDVDTSGNYWTDSDDDNSGLVNFFLTAFGICTIISVFIAIGMTKKEVKGYSSKKPISAVEYLDNSATILTRNNDLFIREFTTSHTVSSSSGGGSSHGGGGHHSSSHHSHGGGGGRHR